MKKIVPAAAAAIIAIALAITTMLPAQAQGKYTWWDNNVTGGWFQSGITCWSADTKVVPGSKAVIYYKLGQSKSFVKMESVVAISGDTLVDSSGNVVDPSTGDGNAACDDPTQAAIISTQLPARGGAYVIRWAIYSKAGKFLYNDDSYVLNAKQGLDSGSSFFSNPPKVFFSSATYGAIGGNYRLKAFTDSGAPRNACLIVYDMLLQSASGSGSIYKADIVSSMQRGALGAALRYQIGSAGVQAGLQCASWLADYLW